MYASPKLVHPDSNMGPRRMQRLIRSWRRIDEMPSPSHRDIARQAKIGLLITAGSFSPRCQRRNQRLGKAA